MVIQRLSTLLLCASLLLVSPTVTFSFGAQQQPSRPEQVHIPSISPAKDSRIQTEKFSFYTHFLNRITRGANDTGSQLDCKLVLARVKDEPFEQRCPAVRLACSDEAALFDYISMIYCSRILSNAVGLAKVVLYPILIILMLSLLASTAEHFFCPTLEILSEELKLSPAVAGITLLAFGNSAPDVFTQFAALNVHRDVAMQMGGLMGASTFCLTGVLGMCVLQANKLEQYPKVSEGSFYRDTSIYIAGLVIIVVISSSGRISLVQATMLLLLYLSYIVIVVVLNWVRPAKRKFKSTGPHRKEGLRAALRLMIHRMTGVRAQDYELVALEDDWPTDDETDLEVSPPSEHELLRDSPSDASMPLDGRNVRLVLHDPEDEITEPEDMDEPGLIDVPSPIPERVSSESDDVNLIDMSSPMIGNQGRTGGQRNEARSGNGHYGETTANIGMTRTFSLPQTDFLQGVEREDDVSDGIEEVGPKGEPELGWFEWPADEGTLIKARYVVEFPFTVMRWLSVPPCDGEWGPRRRWLVCLSPPGLFISSILQFREWDGFEDMVGNTNCPMWALLLAIGVGMSLFLILVTSSNKPPAEAVLLFIAFLSFFGSINWIAILGDEVVSMLTACSVTTNVSTSILGITLLAVGNSIGDLVSCITVTRQGNMAMALGSIFGAPLFHDVAGLGASLLVACMQESDSTVEFNLHPQTYIAWAFLFAALVSIVGVFTFSGLRPPRWYGLALVGGYSLFLFCCFLEEIGVFRR
eukprot:comp12564_c0_seq1/m.7562 comp12564_c0_seq1/g.7562  ORF comp12564_c0_seq1/g.7562 comp12564_c0_seq1/m.7562 type:complete len:753 (-) comp12564_c0_seq1:294-2552(-)